MTNRNTTTIVVKGDTKDADRAIKGLQGRMDGFGSRLSSIRAPLLGITAALGGMAVAATKTFTGFDASMQKIVGLVGLSQEAVDGMRKSVLGLAGTTAQAPSDLADALFAVTSAGQRGEEAIATLANAAQASAAGLGDTKDVALTLVGALQNYGAAGLTAAEATDILLGTVQAGNLEASELAGSLSRVIPIASAAGVGFEQIGGAVALLTRATIPTSEAVTGLRAAILAVNAPTTEAVAAFKEAGISTKDLNDALQSGGLIAALELVEEAAGGNSTMFRKMLGSVEALTVSNVLLNASSQDISETFGEVATATGKTAAAFGVAAETDAFKFQQAMVDIKISLTAIGNIVGPAMANVTEAVSTAVAAFAGMPKPIQLAAVALGGITLALAAIGLALPPVIAGIGALGAVAGAASVGWVAVQLAIFGATGAMVGFNLATGGIVLAIAAVITGIVLLIKNWDAVKDAIGRVLEKLGNWKFALLAIMGPIGAIIAAVTLLKDQIGFLIDKISEAAGWLKFWGDATDDATDSAKTLTKETQNITGAVSDLGTSVEVTAGKTSAAFAKMTDLENTRSHTVLENMQIEAGAASERADERLRIEAELQEKITALVTGSRERMGDAVGILTDIENIHTNTVLENMQALARESDLLRDRRIQNENDRVEAATEAAAVLNDIEVGITQNVVDETEAKIREIERWFSGEEESAQTSADLLAGIEDAKTQKIIDEVDNRLAILDAASLAEIHIVQETQDAIDTIRASATETTAAELLPDTIIGADVSGSEGSLLETLARRNTERLARIDEIEELLRTVGSGSGLEARLLAELAKLESQRSVAAPIGEILAGGPLPILPGTPGLPESIAAMPGTGQAKVEINNFGTINGPDEMEELVVAAWESAHRRGMM